MDLSNVEIMTSVTIPLVLTPGVSHADANLNIPFKPDFILLKNITVFASNLPTDKIWLLRSSLLDDARYLCSFNTSATTLQNVDVMFLNKRDISGTYSFDFYGVAGSEAHTSNLYITLTFTFVRYKHKCLIN